MPRQHGGRHVRRAPWLARKKGRAEAAPRSAPKAGLVSRVLAPVQPAFRIVSVERFAPAERSLTEALSGYAGDGRVHGGDPRVLFLMPEALEALRAHIGWGHDVPGNRNEQGGLLLGTPHIDPRKNLPYALVERAFPATSAQGTSVYLSMDEGVWRDLMQRAEAECPELQIVGWYHTHPGSLRVFMSSTDRATQSRVFFEDWHFALVLNPQRQEWAVFAGAQATPCAGIELKRA